MSEELKLYKVRPKYIKELLKVDKRVYYKDERPFIGIVVVCNGQKYCVPLTTPKEKFSNMKGRIDFGLIKKDGQIVAGIEYSRMIPVEEYLLRKIDTEEHKHDSANNKSEKLLRKYELEWCNLHKEDIVNKVNVLYNTYISGIEFKRRKNCLDFPLLEKVCNEYCKRHPQQHRPK